MAKLTVQIRWPMPVGAVLPTLAEIRRVYALAAHDVDPRYGVTRIDDGPGRQAVRIRLEAARMAALRARPEST